MYQLTHNFSLKNSNTFGVTATAKLYLTVRSEQDFLRFFNENIEARQEKILFLGAGSNLLFLNNFDGLVIHPEILGIRIIAENEDAVEVEVGAGVPWDQFVAWSVGKEWGGVENLSSIPGNTGAVPVQNIGAYGTEAASVISRVNGIDLETLQLKSLDHEECKFGYRTSLFKEQLKEQFMVTSVVFRLLKHPEYNLGYGALQAEVLNLGEPTLQNIRKAVIAIRESKLPDPAKVGNAGSFFKNPVVTEATGTALKNSYPEIPVYSAGPGLVKLAAGWLIEKAGWKGKSVGRSAVHDQQALVIINTGGASGKEIFELSEMVAKDVLQKFGIELEREVQVIGHI